MRYRPWLIDQPLRSFQRIAVNGNRLMPAKAGAAHESERIINKRSKQVPAEDPARFSVLALAQNSGKAEAVRQGMLEAIDRKPPIVPYIYAATFSFFETTALWSVRVVAMLAVALTSTFSEIEPTCMAALT